MAPYKILFIILLFSFKIFAQADSTAVLTFDFNEHEIKEKDKKVILKPVGVTLVDDRFGNEESAVYTEGNNFSYLNLGTSDLLKPIKGTISIWVNLEIRTYFGKGADFNPFLSTKNAKGYDFIHAYYLGYECKSNKFGVSLTKDSANAAILNSNFHAKFNEWQHLVLTFDNQFAAFYLNGKLEGKTNKNFETFYLSGDSIMLGHSACKKNERYTRAIFDDIQFFHRVLSEKEILDLYNKPNPNRLKQFFIDSIKYTSLVLLFVVIIIILIIRNKRKLKRQKEYYELNNRVNELEIKVIKNQMNPHFISNCLAAIQELIYTENYKKAAQYLAKFSFFLRQVLNYSDKTYITLEEELAVIKLNVELEQLRFSEGFDFKINLLNDIELNRILIPSLITQPFIENAIWHGLLPLGNKGKACLFITIYEKDNCIYLEIEDNGVGRNLNNSLPNKNSKGTKLVMDKIETINKMLDENNYKLEIIDLFDDKHNSRGTKIIIQLKNSKE